MLTSDEFLGVVYLQLIGVGFLGNCILLFLNSFNFLIAHRTRPKNLIVIHLAFSNAMVLLFRGLPTTTRLWRVKCILDDTWIAIITYMQRLTRGLSLSSTCLLSVVQAITISPNNSLWVQLKVRAPKYIIPCILLCWLFNMIPYMNILLYQTGPNSSININYGCNVGYRFIAMSNKNQIKSANIAFLQDALFVFLMICSSFYMVLILYRHKRHVKHIHTNSLYLKISPETRATKAILILVGAFVLFNVLSPIFILHMMYFKYISNLMLHTAAVVSLWYPTVSPFILISIDNQIPRTCAHNTLKIYRISTTL